MKLNKLASAVSVSLAALALAACGGSSGSGSSVTTPSTQIKEETIKKQLEEQKKQLEEQKKQLLEEQEKLKKELEAKYKDLDEKSKQSILNQKKDNLVGDTITTINPTIGRFNATKDPSFGAFHYTNRSSVSSFDRAANSSSSNEGSNRIPFDVSMDDTNPHLTNFVLASEVLVGKDGQKYYARNYAGEGYTARGTNGNKLLVSPATATYDTKAQNGRVINVNVSERKTLQDVNRGSTNSNDGNVVLANANQLNLLDINKEGHAKNQYDALFTNSTALGGKSVLEKSGLLIYGTGNGANSGLVLKAGLTEEDSNPKDNLEDSNQHKGSTRIFGKNYHGVAYSDDAETRQLHENTYMTSSGDKGELTDIRPATLHNVQYGRLSVNIDTIIPESVVNAAKNAQASGIDLRVHRELKNRGHVAKTTNGVVDVYFARGTNGTTKEQMDALKVKGLALNYEGHALTYNVGNRAQGASAGNNSLSSSFHTSQNISTIGNFVQATYDTAKDKVVGSVYNYLDSDVNDNKKLYVKQNLINFVGDVAQNSVVGVATNLTEADKNKAQGTLFASFFGADADELGGTITSIQHDPKNLYGEGKWGAVFGAIKTTSGNNFVTANVDAGQDQTSTTTTPAKP